MTLLAPLYLIGLLAAGIPIVLHLIFRRQAQKVFFATVRFLRLSNERTAHRRRVQDLLLLILRTLLFILLALALAQFILKMTEGAGILHAKAQIVLVVDNSYSMAATEQEGRSRYQAARECALAVLRGLQSEDQAAVLFTSGPERRLQPKLTTDLQEVQNTINRSNASAEGGNVFHALRDARELLATQTAGLKEIYILTDLQKGAWETGPKWDEQAGGALERDELASFPVVIFDAGQAGTANLAVREIRVSGQALVQGAPVTIDADIINPTPQPATTFVTLFVSGEAKGKRQLDIPPNGTATTSFAYELPKSGTVAIQVRLPDDPLLIDNERSYKLEVREKIRALVVQDVASAVDLLDQSYFLERALDPSIAYGGPPVSIIRPDRILLKDLARARLKTYDVIFLLNIKTMPDETAAALKEFVRDGGGIIFFAGDDLDPGEYARLFAQPPDPLLPLALQPTDKAPPDRKNFTPVTSVDESHVVFAPFRGLNILKAVRVYKSARVDLHATTPMVTLAQLADGQPLLLAHSCGKGKVVFVTVSATVAWSNLPVTDMFLPMIHQLVYFVCSSPRETDSLAVGAPYRFNFPESAVRVDIDIRRPDGTEQSIATVPAPDSNAAAYTDTFKPGLYTYATHGGVTAQGAFVVNIDTAESNLERASPDEVGKLLAPAPVRICSSVDELEKLVKPLREGVQLRDLFVLVTIIIAVFETVLSNWLTPKQATRKQPILAPAEESSNA